MDINKKEGDPPAILSTSQAPFYDKLTYIYLEMPKFNKTEAELETIIDKWLYALKNLPRLLERPAALQERIFGKFFEVAEIGNLPKDEYAKYWESEKIYYDNDGAIRTAEAKGRAEGRAEGRVEGLEEGEAKERINNARKMKDKGYPIEDIAEITGLSSEEIAA
jgi:predicted transposase/invertase (TIGR01784 family)